MSKRMIATLAAEHLVVLDMADQFRDNLDKLKNGQDLAGIQNNLWEFSCFMEHTLNQHIPQEEEELYPKLLMANPGFQEEVDTMVEEHKVIGQAHSELQQELAGSNPLPESIVLSGSILLDSLETHLKREHSAIADMNK